MVFQVHPRRICVLFVGAHTSIQKSHVEGGGWIGSDLYALATRRVAVVIPEILEKHNNP
jgi:hypothetical protein